MKKKYIYDWYGSSGGGAVVDPLADVWGHWQADDFSGVTPNVVLNDKSGNGRTMTQAAGTLTAGTAANGKAQFTGNATARLTSAATLESWPLTVITVGRRAAGATCGFFGHTGASPFNSSWYGYESTNRFFQYNTNATNNTTSDAGADACWVSRVGYGARVPIVNGILQADMTQINQLRTAATTVSLGTEYRGLNLAWQATWVWNRVLSIAELDYMHALINTEFSMSIPLWSSYTEVDSVWMGGQSNTAGRGDRGASDVNIPAEYDQALTGVNIWYGTPVNNIGTAWETLNINNNNHMLGDSQAATYIGHEVTLGKEYLDRTGRDIYIMKYALGSSYLAFHNNATPHWNFVDNTVAPINANRLYAKSMTNWWQSMRVHQAAGRKPVLKGLEWFQAEQDATVQDYAEAYAANLQIFFAELRRELGISAPVIHIMRIHINGSETYESTVRAQQAIGAAAITGATLIDTDVFATRAGDGVHLSVVGQLDLGTYLAGLL